VSVIVPCIFGTTRGFEIIEMADLPVKMQDLIVAVTHGEVELSLEDTCIKILRIKISSEIYTWIGLYRKAYELGFSREGGYYGAGFWLSDTTVNASQILDVLEDLAQQIRRLALEDRKFQRPLSSIVQQLVPSQTFRTLVSSNSPYVKSGISAEAKNCAFICQPQSAHSIVDWAQNDALAHNFQSVIIAPASAFPKSGASSNITQYADVATLELALDRDYTARLAKSDAEKNDLKRRVQSLEAESAHRNSEIQALRQKKSQLETEVNRSRLLVKRDGKTHVTDDDSSVSEDLFRTLLAVLAVLSVLGNLALGWFLYIARGEALWFESQLVEVRKELAAKDLQLTDVNIQLNQYKTLVDQYLIAQAKREKSKVEDTSSGQAPDSSTAATDSNSKGESSNPPDEANGDSTSEATTAGSRCSWHGCYSDQPPDQPSSEEQNMLGEMSGEATQVSKDIILNKDETKILRAVREFRPQDSADLIGKVKVTKPIGATIQNALLKFKKAGLIEYEDDVEANETRWRTTETGDDYLRSIQE
jgi:hypothetical protein